MTSRKLPTKSEIQELMKKGDVSKVTFARLEKLRGMARNGFRQTEKPKTKVLTIHLPLELAEGLERMAKNAKRTPEEQAVRMIRAAWMTTSMWVAERLLMGAKES